MTVASDIERDLRARYRQPAGVAQFGIEPLTALAWSKYNAPCAR
jgi:hypothetical protein